MVYVHTVHRRIKKCFHIAGKYFFFTHCNVCIQRNSNYSSNTLEVFHKFSKYCLCRCISLGLISKIKVPIITNKINEIYFMIVITRRNIINSNHLITISSKLIFSNSKFNFESICLTYC